jgi:hypothetical protein
VNDISVYARLGRSRGRVPRAPDFPPALKLKIDGNMIRKRPTAAEERGQDVFFEKAGGNEDLVAFLRALSRLKNIVTIHVSRPIETQGGWT